MRRESGLAWLVGRWWFWALAVAILFAQPLVRTFARQPPRVPPTGAAVPPLQLTREDGRPFAAADVADRAWVVAFVDVHDALAGAAGGFAGAARAATADEVLNAMFTLQHRLRNLGDAVRLVTIGTDDPPPPPAALAQLSHAHHANVRVWAFTTGAPAETRALLSAFGARPNDQRLALVDRHGRLRGLYDPQNLDPLVEDLSVVVNGSP